MRMLFISALAVVAGVGTALAGNSPGGFIQYQRAGKAEDGLGMGARYSVAMAEAVYLDGRISYIHFPTFDLDIMPFELAVLARIPAPGAVHPYTGVGFGYYRNNADRGELDDDLGWLVLAGFEYDTDSACRWFGELRWLGLEADANPAFAASEGTGETVHLDGIGVTAGFILSW